MAVPFKGRGPMVTMTEAAKRAGVAQTTVSFARNRKAPAERGVSEKTARRVKQAVEELNDFPSSRTRKA